MLRRRACVVLVAILWAPTISLSAQLGAPNAAGVSIGHVHLTVRNPEEHKKLWLLLGAQVTTAGSLELLKFPWYVKTFGGVAETRRGFPSAVFEGGEINVIQAPERQAPTKGRSIDHIGFEVKGLEAFCKKLQAEGVTFEVPYREVPQLGLKLAFLVDPVGTRIELTEGLAGR